MIAATEIKAGVSRVVVAGGMESMSNAPHFARSVKKGEGIPYSSLESVLMHDGLQDAFTGEIPAPGVEFGSGLGGLALPIDTAKGISGQTIGSYISVVGLGVFFVNIIYAFIKKEKAAQNPWGEGATTLEWTVPSPPNFHTFEELPKFEEEYETAEKSGS